MTVNTVNQSRYPTSTSVLSSLQKTWGQTLEKVEDVYASVNTYASDFISSDKFYTYSKSTLFAGSCIGFISSGGLLVTGLPIYSLVMTALSAFSLLGSIFAEEISAHYKPAKNVNIFEELKNLSLKLDQKSSFHNKSNADKTEIEIVSTLKNIQKDLANSASKLNTGTETLNRAADSLHKDLANSAIKLNMGADTFNKHTETFSKVIDRIQKDYADGAGKLNTSADMLNKAYERSSLLKKNLAEIETAIQNEHPSLLKTLIEIKESIDKLERDRASNWSFKSKYPDINKKINSWFNRSSENKD